MVVGVKMKLLAWLRHKLFGTEFVCVQHGSNIRIKKLKYKFNKYPYVKIHGGAFKLSDSIDSKFYSKYGVISYLYKNKGEQ
jgi:hypothetical protein